MNIEIERKFLVDKIKWQALNKPAPVLIRQAYLLTDPDKTIRVRIMETSAFITIKSNEKGIARMEFEYAIPVSDANKLLSICGLEVSKLRYKIFYDDKLWEIDEFLQENEGLIVAEIELNNQSEIFSKPDWVAKDVTEDKRFSNANLSLHPFSKW